MPVVKRTNHGITLKSGIKKGLDERERERASNKEAAISIKNGIDDSKMRERKSLKDGESKTHPLIGCLLWCVQTQRVRMHAWHFPCRGIELLFAGGDAYN